MKKLLICLTFVLYTNFIYSDALKVCLNKIQQLSEAKDLMATIQKEGPIRFAKSNHTLSKQFGAFWDMDQRVICVYPEFHRNEGEMIQSLIFEMHNALISSKIEAFDRLASERKIGREDYIRSIEHLEYVNSKNASALVEKGIQKGIFPISARMNTYRNFEEHFYYQKLGGHSDWIGKTFDMLTR